MFVCDQRGGSGGRWDFGAARQGAYAGGFSACGAEVSRVGNDAASDVCGVYAMDDAGRVFGFVARDRSRTFGRERGAGAVGDSIVDTGRVAVAGVFGDARADRWI